MTLDWQFVAATVPPLLLIEGFYSGSEIALLSVDKITLKRQAKSGSRAARLALDLANRPEIVLSTTLLMTSLCVILVSSLLAIFIAGLQLGHPGEHSDLIAIAVTSPLVVIFGELIPKTLYQRHSQRVAAWVAYPLLVTYWLFFPVTRLLSLYTSRLARIVGPIEELLAGKKRTTRDDLHQVLKYSKRETEIKSSERRIIKRILDFKNTEAKHALIPLVKVEAVSETSLVGEALERFKNQLHSRMPVYSGRIDNIVGVLEASDLLAAPDLKHPIRNFISSAYYVAETQPLDDLIAEMHQRDNELVIVVDEYGGAVGILTFEDIIEEIVGEIADEYDTETLLHKELSESSWLVPARMEIDQINEVLKLDLPKGEYETVGGFLLQQFGRIPEPRDELFFDTSVGTLKFTVRKASERHIESVLIEKQMTSDSN